MSEQFAHEGAPNGESTESDVVDPAVETDDLSASDVESGAGDTDSDASDVSDDLEAGAESEASDESDEDAEYAGDAESDDAEPAAQGSGDPVADFKADLRSRFGDWFVIHSYAGYENRVKANLETRIQTLNMEDFIFEIEVPMEEVTEIKNGQKKQVRRVRMPGYVLVERLRGVLRVLGVGFRVVVRDVLRGVGVDGVHRLGRVEGAEVLVRLGRRRGVAVVLALDVELGVVVGHAAACFLSVCLWFGPSSPGRAPLSPRGRTASAGGTRSRGRRRSP